MLIVMVIMESFFFYLSWVREFCRRYHRQQLASEHAGILSMSNQSGFIFQPMTLLHWHTVGRNHHSPDGETSDCPPLYEQGAFSDHWGSKLTDSSCKIEQIHPAPVYTVSMTTMRRVGASFFTSRDSYCGFIVSIPWDSTVQQHNKFVLLVSLQK